MTGIILDPVACFTEQGIWIVPRFPYRKRSDPTMFQSSNSEETPVSVPFTLPTYRQETIRHILLGDHAALVEAISHLAALGYCEHLAWSEPIPTGRHGEFISVMTRRRGVTTG